MVYYNENKDPKTGRGKRIKESIDKSGLKRTYIAEELDVSENAIQKWQRTGNISTTMAIKLCNITKTDLYELYFGFEEPKLSLNEDEPAYNLALKLSKLPNRELEIIEALIDKIDPDNKA